MEARDVPVVPAEYDAGINRGLACRAPSIISPSKRARRPLDIDIRAETISQFQPESTFAIVAKPRFFRAVLGQFSESLASAGSRLLR